jgi:hypothetical protein
MEPNSEYERDQKLIHFTITDFLDIIHRQVFFNVSETGLRFRLQVKNLFSYAQSIQLVPVSGDKIWAQLSRLLPKDRASSIRNRVRTVNVQKVNNSIVTNF